MSLHLVVAICIVLLTHFIIIALFFVFLLEFPGVHFHQDVTHYYLQSLLSLLVSEKLKLQLMITSQNQDTKLDIAVMCTLVL